MATARATRGRTTTHTLPCSFHALGIGKTSMAAEQRERSIGLDLRDPD
jgi:hypothetical protein